MLAGSSTPIDRTAINYNAKRQATVFNVELFHIIGALTAKVRGSLRISMNRQSTH